MFAVDDDVLDDVLLKFWDIKEIRVACKINCEASQAEIEKWPAYEYHSNALFVCLIKGSLSLNKTLKLLVSQTIQRILWIFVDTTHALVSYIKD